MVHGKKLKNARYNYDPGIVSKRKHSLRKLRQRIQRRYSEDKGERGRERGKERERETEREKEKRRGGGGERASERASEPERERERERDREGWENGGSEDIRHQIEGDAIAKRGTAPLSSVLASPSVIGPSNARYPNWNEFSHERREKSRRDSTRLGILLCRDYPHRRRSESIWPVVTFPFVSVV